MFFKNYYDILDIEENAIQELIKIAFKKQALRWHPDRNPNQDTTIKMQDINEAYLILKDPEARKKFESVYASYKEYKQKQQGQSQTTSEGYSSDFKVEDETLKKWMENARRQAVDLAQQTIRDFKGMTQVGIEAGAKEAGKQIINFAIIGGIILLIMFVKTCS